MSDTAEMWRAIEAVDKLRRESNRDRAAQSFSAAKLLAAENGFMLLCHTDAHYQLRHVASNWLLDIWPGKQRIKRHRGDWPHLSLPDPWTLIEVVRESITAASED